MQRAAFIDLHHAQQPAVRAISPGLTTQRAVRCDALPLHQALSFRLPEDYFRQSLQQEVRSL